jgi:hypothetical protein
LIFYRGLIPITYKFVTHRPYPFDRFQIPELIITLNCVLLLTALGGYYLRSGAVTLRPVPPLFMHAVITGMVILALWPEGRAYYRWVRTPDYVVQTVGRDIMTYIGPDGYVGGMDAPGVAYDTPYKTLISWDQYVNYAENPITKYGLTHLFLANNRSIREDQYYRKKYPQEMQKAVLLQQYSIKDSQFSLFSLVETRLEKLAVAKTTYTSGEPLQAQVRLKNDDFRRAKLIALNWAVYPMTLTADAKPAGTGESIQISLPPEQSENLPLTGNLPIQPGQYRLLVSWNAAKASQIEAEQMPRQLGQVVADDQASGQRAVYQAPQVAPGAGFLAFGNYRDAQAGVYQATFRVKIGKQSTTDKLMRLEVAANTGKMILQQRDLKGADFSAPEQYTTFTLPYLLTQYTSKIEFRVFSYGQTDIWVDTVQGSYQEGIWYPEPLTIADKKP